MSMDVTRLNDLSPKQRRALEALFTQGDVSGAAKAAGVSRQSLYRWLGEPGFSTALRKAESMALDGLSRTLVRLGDKAAGALEAALDDDEAPHSVKLRAADVVTGRLLQVRELVTIEQRLAAIEQALEAKR